MVARTGQPAAFWTEFSITGLSFDVKEVADDADRLVSLTIFFMFTPCCYLLEKGGRFFAEPAIA
jgi:hypothetical protein